MNYDEGLRVSQFWVATYPFFRTRLYVSPGLAQDRGFDEGTHLYCQLFDPDGASIGETEMTFPAGQAGSIDLDELLAAGKLESGLKHARLLVKAPSDSTVLCRVIGQDSGAFSGPAHSVTANQSALFPIIISPDRIVLFGVINEGVGEATVRMRVHLGEEMIEAVRMIPGRGARILTLLGDLPDLAAKRGTMAYVRFWVRGDHSLGVQLVERSRAAVTGFAYGTSS